MKYISRSFINKLLCYTNIVKVISSKINVKKVGNKYIAFCPFHLEKNPSFVINENDKYYYCFGCKTYGNIIDFLMRFNHINFLDSIKELCNINCLDFKFNYLNYNKKLYDNKNYYLKLILKICNIYHNSLLFDKESFFVKNILFNRGINIKLIKFFLIGYSSKKIINKINYYFNKNEIKFFIKLGILKKKSNKIYDSLYNRIIFPIYDIYNRIIAFSGRTIYKNYKYKYINIKKNLYFNKKYCLYGFNYIRKKNLKLNKILIVEGYFDVITLNKYGIYYVVGLLGSHICIKQIIFLYNYTNKIIFCYDGDESGLISTKKTLFLMLKYINLNKKLYFIFLPSNYDPDLFIRENGILNFKNKINKAKSLYDILCYCILKKNCFSYENKIFFVNKFLSFINKINSPLIKLFLYNKLYKKVGLNQNKIISIIKNFYNNKIFIKNNNIFRYLISILLKYTYLSNYININDKIFNLIYIYNLSLFLKIVNICLFNNNISILGIMNYFNNNRIKFYIEYLYINNFIYIKKNNEKFVFFNILNKLKIFLINKKINFYYSKYSISKWNIKRKKKIWNLIKLKNFIL